MKRKIIFFVLFAVIIVVFTCCMYSTYVIDVKGLNITDADNYIAYSDYVFVGEVLEVGETGSANSEPSKIPYTNITIKVEENLKGTLVDEVKIKKIGGESQKTKLKYVIKSNGKKDVFPKVGEKYIFITSCEQDGTIISQFDGSLLLTKENYSLVKNSIDKDVEFIKERYTSEYDLY